MTFDPLDMSTVYLILWDICVKLWNHTCIDLRVLAKKGVLWSLWPLTFDLQMNEGLTRTGWTSVAADVKFWLMTLYLMYIVLLASVKGIVQAQYARKHEFTVVFKPIWLVGVRRRWATLQGNKDGAVWNSEILTSPDIFLSTVNWCDSEVSSDSSALQLHCYKNYYQHMSELLTCSFIITNCLFSISPT